jgi:hypothetical protein
MCLKLQPCSLEESPAQQAHAHCLQVSFLSKKIDELWEQANKQLASDEAWLDAYQTLKNASGIVKGSGPGGDL